MRFLKTVFTLLLCLVACASAAYVAVLETGADPSVQERVPLADRQYLTNVLREEAVKLLPATQGYTIMTRENISAMLPPGKSIEDCEGSCLAETGKNISADYICQARVGSFDGMLTLSAELYETASNKLVASFNARGSNLSELLELVKERSPEFFRGVKNEEPRPEEIKSENLQTAETKTEEPKVEKENSSIMKGVLLGVGAAVALIFVIIFTGD
jgi:hypothetical protein